MGKKGCTRRIWSILLACLAGMVLLVFQSALAALPPIDRDYDGDVDASDLAGFAQNFALDDPAAELDASGAVDSGDVARMAGVFGPMENYHLQPDSTCVDAGTELPAELPSGHDLALQYVPHQRYTARPSDDAIDLGAFENKD
jgi:hypothetical protein